MVLIKKEGFNSCIKIEQEKLKITQSDLKEIGVVTETYKIKHACLTIYGMMKLVDNTYLLVV